MTNVKKFNIVQEGYDIYEVNKFLKVVTSEFEKLVQKNAELESKVQELNAIIDEYEVKSNSVELYKEELDGFIDKRKDVKTSLEYEIGILEEKLESYNKALNALFYDHIEMINKLK